ncbi:MAG: phosphoribosylformylglycinamidine synthase [Fusobacteriota bacterium]
MTKENQLTQEKFRIFVKKKDKFDVESKSLLSDLRENLMIQGLQGVKVINVYDIFDINKKDLEKAKNTIFSEPPTDKVYETLNLENKLYFAVEYLPGQFDQRADSAQQCLSLITDNNDAFVKSGKVLILKGDLSKKDIEAIKDYYINPVESREKDLDIPLFHEDAEKPKDVPIFDGFRNLNEEELKEFKSNHGLAMSDEDLEFIQKYFNKEEKRDPSETEIKVLDTYWSDHCRHTTFETEIKDVVFPKGEFKETLQNTFNEYIKSRKVVGREEKPMTLMDMAVISMREERKNGNLDDLEISEEINACSIRIKVDVEGEKQDWLLQFKNETHNHPTEIEPFGGASTCIGGAIRDPLSGRAYVYQAMRITGAADIKEDVKDTMEGKLPQKVISKVAAEGYSSYGNQIGLSTTYVKELFHEGYKAKRMEVGAVVGAVPEKNVRRESPKPGDKIIMLGGKTGRDGCGGATGSSKEHTTESLTSCSAEVQKGNAPEERKIQRLFRNSEVTALIKKSNDFGAGGVSVAIGELAPGLVVDLDKVFVKYNGLNGTELAISESQERMSVVVSPEDVDKFKKLADEENIQSVVVAEVKEEERLIIKWRGQDIVNISREFLETNGYRQTTNVEIEDISGKAPFKNQVPGEDLEEQFLKNLERYSVASQKGLAEMFDASIGATTVLMPYGGKYQLSKPDASVQKIPYIGGETNTASIMSFGFNPNISSWSPYHGAAYAVVESISKVVAVGGNWEGIRFSFQEFFERLGEDPKKWGKPFSALLGSLYVQKQFGLPAIGGKDSMSGTFNDLDVPPTLISFAVNTESADNIISPDFKEVGNYVYMVKHEKNKDLMPNIDQLKKNYTNIYENVKKGNIISASALKAGGIGEVLSKMAFGNMVGIEIDGKYSSELFDMNYGTVIVESSKKLELDNFELLGKTIKEEEIIIGDAAILLRDAKISWEKTFKKNYPIKVDEDKEEVEIVNYQREKKIITRGLDTKPRVFVPVFPGTNCEYDSMNQFIKAGAIPKSMVFKNKTHKDIEDSLRNMKKNIDNSQIIMLSGGFSAGDEPDGSGKFIANVLENEMIKDSIYSFLERDGLILGICNGFQALLKSGLLPYGEIGKITKDSPTLTKNNINRHISKVVNTRISSNKSPWLSSNNVGSVHKIAVSHGEGKFVAKDVLIEKLFNNGQVATQYSDLLGNPTMNGEYNPNGSYMAIEGITSKDGRIFGKMGHSERIGKNVLKNIKGNKNQGIFKNGVKYFK